MNDLRKAAEQALEALESLDVGDTYKTHNAASALRQALAQPEQEPVAWMSPGKERLEFSRKDTVYGSHTIPLYAAPPIQQEMLKQAYLDGVNSGIKAIRARSEK